VFVDVDGNLVCSVFGEFLNVCGFLHFGSPFKKWVKRRSLQKKNECQLKGSDPPLDSRWSSSDGNRKKIAITTDEQKIFSNFKKTK
jgi:hypothetical protein